MKRLRSSQKIHTPAKLIHAAQQLEIDPIHEQIVDQREHVFDVPEATKDQHQIIEFQSNGQQVISTHLPNQMNLDVAENFGRLQLRKIDQQPLPKAYVKVYGRDKNGNIHYIKDGYTDLRGKFDYISVSREHAAIKRYSLLILSKDHGTLIREVDAPAAPETDSEILEIPDPF